MPMPSSAESPQPLARVLAGMRNWIGRLGEVWVEGQVIAINRRSSPTQFLTLRDSRSTVSATMTCSRVVLDAAGPIIEGSAVVARVRPRVFEQNTSLTLECAELRPVGEGQLLVRLEQLKNRLQAEGLFAPQRKRPLPFVPRVVGLITGQGSDAERDVVTNARLRWPPVQFRIENTLVQGSQAADQVMAALERLEADPEVDVIVIARGGGAVEDLLAFSDEGLVRAVAAMTTPVVSAIGHEKDAPILDNVADVRASTPTDAAKRIVPDHATEVQGLATARERLRSAMARQLDIEQRHLEQLRSRPVLRNPLAPFEVHTEQLEQLRVRLGLAIERAITDEQREVGSMVQRVRSLSPKQTLERGYAILTDGEQTFTSVTQLDVGDDLLAYLADGELVLEVSGRPGQDQDFETFGAGSSDDFDQEQ